MTPRGARPSTPPAVATGILRAALPTDRRGESILGDLLEDWHERPAGIRRRLWYWRECLRLAARYARVPPRLPGGPPQHGGRGRAGRGSLLAFDDLRQSIRQAARAPLVTVVTVLALGVGVAAPTVMYALLVGVTRDLPVPDPDALVHVGRRFTPTIIRGADVAWLRPFLATDGTAEGVLESVGAFSIAQHDVSGEEGFAERRRAAAISPGVFTTLSVEPVLGRGITEGDLGGNADEPVVVVSDALWRERFDADPGVLGRTLRIDGRRHVVVGVMPRGFAFPDDTELWVALDPFAPAPGRSAELVGRLAPSGSLAALQQRTGSVMEGLRDEGVVAPDGRATLAAEPWSNRGIDANGRRLLAVMVLVVSFVLVIACANVAHLFLARALSRRRSTAVRLALGSGRWRVVRRHLVEASVLSLLGGTVGIAIAAVGVRLLAAGMAPRLAWWMEIRLDPAVGAFAAGLVLLAALLTGIVPAVQASRSAGVPVLQGAPGSGRATSGRGIRRVTGALVVAEVALACTLLVVAGLLTRGALRNLEADRGFDTTTVLAASYDLRPDEYPSTAEVGAFHRRLLEDVGDRPDIVTAAVTSHLPAIFSPMESIEIAGRVYQRPEDRPTTHVVRISPGFLDALGVAPVRGRDLDWTDGDEGALGILVNEPFVRQHLDGQDPLGTRIRVVGRGSPSVEAAPGAWGTVVGVVPDLGVDNGRDFDDTGIYLPLMDAPPRSAHLLLRAGPGAAVEALTAGVRTTMAELDPDVALRDMDSLGGRIAATRDMERLFAQLFAFFGLCGLILAGVGLYALMAFTVGRRIKELGIRAAVGARPAALVWTTVRSGVLQISAGVAIGLGLGALVAPLFGTLFMGYDPGDPVAYVTVALTLIATGSIATLGPARRASSVDLAEVLRGE